MCRGQSNRTLMPCTWWAGGRSLRQTLKMKIEISRFTLLLAGVVVESFAPESMIFHEIFTPILKKKVSVTRRKSRENRAF